MVDSFVDYIGVRIVCPNGSSDVSRIWADIRRDPEASRFIDISIYNDNASQLTPLPEVIIAYRGYDDRSLRTLPQDAIAIMCVANGNQLGMVLSGY